jgi:Cation transport ATPase
MKDFIETREDLINRLNTSSSAGLTNQVAAQNKTLYGSNSLTKEKPESLAKRIWGATKEPMILMLIMAGIITVAVNIVRGYTSGETDYLECIGIFSAIALSVFITVAMEGKSAKAFEALSKISDDITVKILRNGDTIVIEQKEIVVGRHSTSFGRR